MIRVLVMSDTHGNLKNAQKALQMAGDVDLIVHAGDNYADGTQLGTISGVPVIGVAGNRDYLVNAPEEEVFKAEDIKVYVTHGHEHAVSSRVTGLERRAKQLGAKVVVYGHTHVPLVQWIDDRLYVNPGSLHLPRSKSGKTFAILEVNGDTAAASVVSIEE